MRSKLKRACSALVAVAAAVTIVPLLNPPAAGAVGVLQGAASVRTAGGAASLSSGIGSTVFTLRLPANAACGGDSVTDGYQVQSYMVPASVDPSTLTFDAAGPTPQGVGAAFRQPLYDAVTTGAYVSANTLDNPGTPRPRPGEVINIPNFSYEAFGPGDILPGAYNIGLACTLGPPGPTQMKEYWNVTKTFTANPSGGGAQVSWSVGASPAAPVLSAPLGAAETSLTATFTHAASTPASTFTATAVPNGADPDCASASTVTTAPPVASVTPITVPGLVTSCEYSVTVAANNGVGSPSVSNAVSGTPVAAARPPVTNLTATPGAAGAILVDWDPPASGPAPTGYSVAVLPADAGPFSLGAATTSQNVTGLTAGTLYTFTVTPLHPSPFVGSAASAQATPFGAQVLQQHLQVTRPVGALVLTQVCGANGPLPAEGAQLGFPAGTLPAVPADNVGAAPFTDWPGTVQDASFAEYPYPVDANEVPDPVYPTHCGVDLGIAKLVTSGPGSGQFFRASGVLNQVSVVDTRDSDDGWTINGTMGAFTSGASSFSGSQLGWLPSATDDSDSFTDSNGTTYDQLVLPGPGVAPNSPNASGLGSGRELGHAVAGSGLGIGVLDARLKLLIPVTANSGVYTGVLSITSV
ncbi:MAG: fibronectin type III domain-containing protein [Acidimicrobiales bacterium]